MPSFLRLNHIPEGGRQEKYSLMCQQTARYVKYHGNEVTQDEYKAIDALITNFHLPKSTLVMLVSAFSSVDIIMNAYRHAMEEKYKFFSFGDAMFLTNEEVK